MKVTGKYLIEQGGVDTKPGYEIDPDKEYWYDPVTQQVHEPLSRRQRIWHFMPWMRWADRRRLGSLERERRRIMEWEFSHLPDDFVDRQAGATAPLPDVTFGRCLAIVMGHDLFSDDSLYLEMAADTICSLLAEHPTAEEAFRSWFVTRYPQYG
jgi:hypothetical protein